MYRVVSRAPNDTADRKAMQVRANLGSAKLAAGDVDGGLADLSAVVAGRPLFYNGWLALGRGQLQHASPATAMPALDRAVALLPLRADAYVLRGRARQELDRHAGGGGGPDPRHRAGAGRSRAALRGPAAARHVPVARWDNGATPPTIWRWPWSWPPTTRQTRCGPSWRTYARPIRWPMNGIGRRRSRTRRGVGSHCCASGSCRTTLGRREPLSDPAPLRLPAAGATVVFTPHDGYDEVTVETGSVRRLDLPPLPARSRIASVSPDGTHLLVGSGTLIREVQLPDGEPTPVLQGTWYTQAAHLTDGLAVVLASGAAVTLPLSDPDVRALLEVRGYVPSAGETSVATASNDALYLIDISADRDDDSGRLHRGRRGPDDGGARRSVPGAAPDRRRRRQLDDRGAGPRRSPAGAAGLLRGGSG